MNQAERLACALPKARRCGLGWVACCPAHNDTNPSLSITEKDGTLLVNCFAGCDPVTVIKALKARDLWPDQDSKRGIIVAHYDYCDASGQLLYQVVRLQPKSFRQRYPNGRGGWSWKKYPRQVLYRLREVIESAIVFIVEGEKDVETLRAHGFTATTNAGGANAPWLESYSEALRGRQVVLIPDNDPPGWRRASTIARSLLGKASRIVVLNLPREFKDVSDWFQAGHSETELIAMIEGVCYAD